MRTKGSKNITERNYRWIKELQSHEITPRFIHQLTGIGEVSQSRIAKSESWQDWKHYRKEQRTLYPPARVSTKTSSTNHTQREAQQNAVKYTIDVNRLGALEELVQIQGRSLHSQRKILSDIRNLLIGYNQSLERLINDLDKSSADDKLAADIAAIPHDAPISVWRGSEGKR